MGQYYKPAFLKIKNGSIQVTKWLSAHEYDNGVKLKEHSWLGNTFVSAVEGLLVVEPRQLVWAGDYADSEEESGETIYELCTTELKVKPDPRLNYEGDVVERDYFIVNHTKKLYVGVNECPEGTGDWAGWRIHPLPLLTVEGNGRGGGDYRGINTLVGTWARDLIQIMNDAPEGYEELQPNFEE